MKTTRWLDDSDRVRWDAFVDAHPLGGLAQTSAWQRLLEGSFSHIHGRICAMVDDESQAIVAGIPVYTVRSWLLGNRVVSVPFATLSDPLVSDADQLDALLVRVKKLVAETSARYLEIRTLNSS